MLAELQITNLGVIAEAQLTLGPGLTVLSGETGAGKTMVVSSIDLIMGRRASGGQVRAGASRLQVSARITSPTPASVQRLAEAGGELDDGDLLLVRQINVAGRTRFHAGGTPVPASVVAELVADQLDIHGQSEQVKLARPGRQREILDEFAGASLLAVREHYRRCYDRHRVLAAELADLRISARARAQEADLLRFGLDEITAVDPAAGEDEQLLGEQQRLQSVDELRLAAHQALTALAGDSDADLDTPDATILVGQARRTLAGISDPPANALAERAAELSFLLADLVGDLSQYLADLASDPARLEWISARRADLARLTRKYGDTLAEVLAWAEQATTRLAELDTSEERIGELELAVANEQQARDAAAAELTRHRRRAAEQLSMAVRSELAALAMEHARLDFDLTALAEPGPWGSDRVEIMFTPNPGQQRGPLASIASGGELSRVRLALEVCLLSANGPTMVFDEVDAGVGGQVATEIGRRLHRLAERGQILVVTHLAQVAAFADRHYVVHKTGDQAVTISDITEVTGEDRICELARMLSGNDSATARAHAAELLNHD